VGTDYLITGDALMRLIAAKRDLITRLRVALPSDWLAQIGTFLARMRDEGQAVPPVVLVLLLDVFREMKELTGQAGRRRGASELPLVSDANASELSVDTLCARFDEEVRAWLITFRSGALVASVHARRISIYIDDHFTEPITLARLSQVSGWDGRHLARVFRAEIGITIREYLNSRRVDAAAAKLREGDKVESVIASVGWKGRKNFFRHFKRRFGVTPAQYRAHWMAQGAA
jgi:AraC-like DNA-binding protein